MSNPYAPPPRGSDGTRTPRGPEASRHPEEGSAPPGVPTTPGTTLAPVARDTGARPLDTRTPPGARPPQDPERVAAANRRVVTFGVLMLTTLFCLQLDLPWQAISLVTAIASLVAGVRALTAVWRAGARGAPIVVLSSVLMMAGLLTLATVGTLLLWPVQMERQDCLRGALTISAQEQCQSAFQEAIQERLSPGVGTEP